MDDFPEDDGDNVMGPPQAPRDKGSLSPIVETSRESFSQRPDRRVHPAEAIVQRAQAHRIGERASAPPM